MSEERERWRRERYEGEEGRGERWLGEGGDEFLRSMGNDEYVNYYSLTPHITHIDTGLTT